MRLILLGPPGSGKGTQAKLLCRRLGLEHIGTGDIIRAAMEHHTPVGERARPFVESGNLVPDDLVNDLIAEHFYNGDPHQSFVMDGYPRTLAQAQAFDQMLYRKKLPISAVLLLDVSDDEIIRRVGGRWSCPKKGCKATYHTESNPPGTTGVCDDCGTKLVQRSDDLPETVCARLLVYHRDTAELIPYYRARQLLHEVPGQGEIERIYNSLIAVLKP
ncbi:MAG: adenylate kinase [Gemmataceae bacterium]